jgi:hypothetical protein
MPKLVLTNAFVSIASVDLSSSISSVSLNTTFDIVETTAFGDTAKKRVASLADNSVVLNFIKTLLQARSKKRFIRCLEPQLPVRSDLSMKQ